MVSLGRARCRLLVERERHHAHAEAHRRKGPVQHPRLHLDGEVDARRVDPRLIVARTTHALALIAATDRC
jgi:hypothetical protein